MADIKTSLIRWLGGEPGPQYKVKGQLKMNPHEGDVAPFYRIVDENASPYGDTNRFPTADADLQAKIDALNAKVDGIIDGTTPAATELKGRKVEEVIFFNALAITDLSFYRSDPTDISKYDEMTFLAHNSHDQDVVLKIQPESPLIGTNSTQSYDGTAFKQYILTIPGNSSARYTFQAKDIGLFLPTYKVTMIANCTTTAPTTGSLSLVGLGGVN